MKLAPWEVACLSIALIFGVPAVIYAYLVRGDFYGQINMFKNAGKRAQNPWKPEDDSLAELSKKVEELKKDRHG
jgi:hypothetical protein